MGYIEHSLSETERIIYRARFPWFYSAGALAVLVLAAVFGIAAFAAGYGGLAVVLMLGGLALFAAIMVPIWSTEIGVTDQRLIDKRGLLWRKTQELQLRAIEEVNLEQGILGRLFDFGQLSIHGTGVDDIRLPTLADPVGLRKSLQDGMAVAAQPILAGGGAATHVAGQHSSAA
jgi:uncharacterized membrane protein YdbT with pleckstrin-like domain